METVEVLVEPAVTRAKFDAEVAKYRQAERTYHRRGCWLLAVEFPRVIVAFAHPGLRPPSVIVGIEVGFENYDFWAPSVRFVDPFTREPYPPQALPTGMARRVPVQPPPGFVLPPGMALADEIVPLVQAAPGKEPFICLSGIREYHEHPAHTGDSWLLYRGRGEGTLAHICEQVLRYAIDPIKGYRIGMQVTGFNAPEQPT